MLKHIFQLKMLLERRKLKNRSPSWGKAFEDQFKCAMLMWVLQQQFETLFFSYNYNILYLPINEQYIMCTHYNILFPSHIPRPNFFCCFLWPAFSLSLNPTNNVLRKIYHRWLIYFTQAHFLSIKKINGGGPRVPLFFSQGPKKRTCCPNHHFQQWKLFWTGFLAIFHDPWSSFKGLFSQRFLSYLSHSSRLINDNI